MEFGNGLPAKPDGIQMSEIITCYYYSRFNKLKQWAGRPSTGS